MTKRLDAYKEKVLELLVLGLLLLLVQRAHEWVADRLVAQPWHVLWFVCPLLIAAAIGWMAARGRRELVLRGRLLVFFVAYILAFSLASSSDLLVWDRNLTVFERKLHCTWLVPASWGDWRYRIAPKKALVSDDLLVVTTEETDGRPLDDLRLEVAKLITAAAKNRARGVAFDFYFARDSNLDSVICRAVQQADTTDVIIGFTLERVNGEIRPLPTAPGIENCLSVDRQGHLVGLVESDNVVRLIPLYFRWHKDRPSLSFKVAQSLAEIGGTELKPPPSDLLRFIEPKGLIPQVSYRELADDPAKCKLMRDCWVLVGENLSSDTFLTPFGQIPGVLIHAYAIHSLRHGHFLTRTPWWSGLLMTLLSCYVIFSLVAQRASRVRIIGTALLLSALIVAASIVALVIWLIWLDVIYVLVAIWLLVSVLILFGKSTTAASAE
jgi:CHASE2 domain-containing sensor protein